MPRRESDRATPERLHVPQVRLARNNDAAVVRRHHRSGDWERIGRGTYLVAAASQSQDERTLAAVGRIVGVHQRLRVPHWFSHESAALLWGLRLWTAPDTTHLLQPYRESSTADPMVTRHFMAVPDDELTRRHGLPVTTLERTVVDCATSLDPLHGLVIADSALRHGADPARISQLVMARRGHRGIARARAVVGWADEGAESPGESATRFIVLRDGFPAPTTQIPVPTGLGTFWADLGWPEWRLLLEYDGRSKYAENSADAFMREKRRHDAVVETGWRVVRVTKEDLRGTLLLRRLRPLVAPDVAAGLRQRPELSS